MTTSEIKKLLDKYLDNTIGGSMRSHNHHVQAGYIQGFQDCADLLLPLVEALEFYKSGEHFYEQGGRNYTEDGQDCSCYFEPENPSGEPLNYLEGHGDYGYEDGSIARQALNTLAQKLGGEG